MEYCYFHGYLHHHYHFKHALRLFHYIYPLQLPNILVLCLSMSYNSRIILIKIATYYSQNYAGILGSGLLLGWYVDNAWSHASYVYLLVTHIAGDVQNGSFGVNRKD